MQSSKAATRYTSYTRQSKEAYIFGTGFVAKDGSRMDFKGTMYRGYIFTCQLKKGERRAGVSKKECSVDSVNWVFF